MFGRVIGASLTCISHSRGGSAAPASLEERMETTFRPHLCLAEPEPELLPDLPCQLADPELWFSERPAELELAKALCAECPVRQSCFAGALRRGEYCGVWGGEIFYKGEVVAAKRGRGRPRKHPLPAPRSAERDLESSGERRVA